VRWFDATWPELKDAAAAGAIVIVPVGAVEQHGHHLPTGTDALCAEHLVQATLELTRVPVVMAPVVHYGYSDDHLGFPGTLSISAKLLEDMLVEVGRSILVSGFCRIIFINGHGSNDRLLYYAVRRLRTEARQPLALAAATYWKLAAQDLTELRHSPLGGMGHACELETSLVLHFRPEVVQLERAVREIPPPYSRYRGTDLLAPGSVIAPDMFKDLTRSGVSGDPLAASADQGSRFALAIAKRLAEFLDEFAAWPLSQGGQT
jgi:creatinine amidohydrolase